MDSNVIINLHLYHGFLHHQCHAQVSLAMALAVPFTAVAFASFDVPLLGPGQPLDRRPAVKSPGEDPVVIRGLGPGTTTTIW